MNPFDILKNLNLGDLSKKTDELMQQLKEESCSGEAGGGFVKVTINGNFEIISIDYEENNIISDDLTTFRDLIIIAQNNAVEKMRTIIQQKFSNNLIPGMF